MDRKQCRDAHEFIDERIDSRSTPPKIMITAQKSASDPSSEGKLCALFNLQEKIISSGDFIRFTFGILVLIDNDNFLAYEHV